MALFRLPIACFLTFSFVVPQSSLLAEQFSTRNDSSADLAPSGADFFAADDSAAPDGSYLETVAKAEAKSDQPFRPTPSDLLVQQAEERFQAGRNFYKVKDAGSARGEFDRSIDLMLQASENPSDRALYEDKLERLVDAIHRLDLAGLGSAAPAPDEPQFEKAPLEDLLQMTFPVDPKLKNKVQGELTATASQLPLVINDSVLGYINYFSGRGHRTIVAGLERAGKYRPMISRILAEEGVPQELIHLAQAESGFLPRAVSNKAATGMWQFVKFRGQQYGLNQTAFTDERLDPEKATRAAARHLKDLYTEFGDWYLAIAAYNCGPGNIEKAVERTGYADFWELRARHAIPTETTNYVPIILAMTIMTKNAAEYGLTDVVAEVPVEYDSVEITAPTHLALVGDLTDTPVSQLTALNPALLRNVAPLGYSVRVPKGAGATLSASLDQVPAMQRASWRMHRVESGDTLTAIAKRYNSSAGRIAQANQLTAPEPEAGDRLLIPAGYADASARLVAARFSTRRALHTKTARRTTIHHRSSAMLAHR
ncbi:MAG: transglycosylase SLT domain-containing protein [Acidobacteriota bacterium]|nr:transglycosylase SLT domain-containing protein [Acidobacteriota bacterium]